MTVISFVSFSGAPGVTTLALATAAALTETDVPEPVMLEAATSGGVLADQYDLPTEPGLASLTVAIGAEPPDLLAHAQALPGGVPVVVAPPSGSRTAKLLAAKADRLAPLLKGLSEVVVVDCGRISVDTPVLPMLRHSSLVPVVIRPSRQDFHLAALTLAEINETLDVPLPAGWVIVGSCPWTDDEIVNQYGLPIFTTIPEDRAGAEAVGGLRKFRRRSLLARGCRSFADDLAKHLRISDDDAPLSYLNLEQPEYLAAKGSEPDHRGAPADDPGEAAVETVETVETDDPSAGQSDHQADASPSATVAIGGGRDWSGRDGDQQQLGASAR